MGTFSREFSKGKVTEKKGTSDIEQVFFRVELGLLLQLLSAKSYVTTRPAEPQFIGSWPNVPCMTASCNHSAKTGQ
jgi:hypothetical protein